jgi:Protein of unknown function (DUF2568)
MTETLKSINAGLAFVLELVMLTAIGYWGFYGGKSSLAKWILGIGLPVLTAVAWAMFLAPRAARRLGNISGNLLSLILFLAAAGALFSTGHTVLAIIFASTAIVNRALILLWKQW